MTAHATTFHFRSEVHASLIGLAAAILTAAWWPVGVVADEVKRGGDGVRTYRNPIIDRIGPADPHVLKYEGKYYLYPTTDGRGYEVYVSEDLVQWTRLGRCFSDERRGLWAPDVFHHAEGDGKFYLYYTVNSERGAGGLNKVVGVAVADVPTGPFRDHGPLAAPAIDAHLFADEDGSLWLYYVNLDGGFKIMVQSMSDPLTKSGEPSLVISPTEAWEKRRGEVTEGPWMLKHRGKYNLMYSGSGADGPEYAIGYATADNPAGPFTKFQGNPIVQAGDGVYGPGHHCVVKAPDDSLWMVYHQQQDDRPGWKRFLAIDPLSIDDDGLIRARATRDVEHAAPGLRKEE